MEITPGISTNFLRFDAESTISEMIGSLKKEQQKAGLVFRRGKYVGVVEKKRLLRVNLDPTTMKVGNYLHATPTLNEHADIIETAYLMHQSNVDLVPVINASEVIGVLSALDLLRLAAALPEVEKVPVSDLRLLETARVLRDDPLSKAIDIMFKDRIDEIPVFDGKSVAGAVSFQDILRKYLSWPAKREYSRKLKKEQGGSKGAEPDFPTLANLPVSTFSTNENLISIDRKAPLKEAIELMAKKNISCLLVYENKAYAGILTVKKILRHFASLEVPANFNIQYLGLNQLTVPEYEKESFQKVASNESFKLQRLIHDDFKLHVHVKAHEQGGERQKFSVAMRAEFPGRIVTGTQHDWDLVMLCSGDNSS